MALSKLNSNFAFFFLDKILIVSTIKNKNHLGLVCSLILSSTPPINAADIQGFY